jgi:hypothetical protein
MRDGEHKPALGVEDSGDLPNYPSRIADVHEGHVRDHQGERGVAEAEQAARIATHELSTTRVGPFPAPDELKAPRGRVDPPSVSGPLPSPTPRQVAISTREVGAGAGLEPTRRRGQRRVDDRTVPEVSLFTHAFVPPSGKVLPTDLQRHVRTYWPPASRFRAGTQENRPYPRYFIEVDVHTV